MRYATITEVYGNNFSTTNTNAYAGSELLSPMPKNVTGIEENGQDLEQTNSVQNIVDYKPVQTRQHTRHHSPAHPAASTIDSPSQYPGYLRKGLPPTQYKAIEKYNNNIYNPYYNNGPSKINQESNEEPGLSAGLSCDIDNYPCEAYLWHFKQCKECQKKLKTSNKDEKEGFLEILGLGDDMSDIILFILGALLIYLLFLKQGNNNMLG